MNRAAQEPNGRGPSGEPDTHLCPVKRCRWRVPAGKLLCPPHWRALPSALRAEIWRAWDSGRGRGTPEHTAACLAAVAWLNERSENQ